MDDDRLRVFKLVKVQLFSISRGFQKNEKRKSYKFCKNVWQNVILWLCKFITVVKESFHRDFNVISWIMQKLRGVTGLRRLSVSSHFSALHVYCCCYLLAHLRFLFSFRNRKCGNYQSCNKKLDVVGDGLSNSKWRRGIISPRSGAYQLFIAILNSWNTRNSFCLGLEQEPVT